MIDLMSVINAANNIGKSLSSVYSYLSKRSDTKNVDKKFVFRELKTNLKRLENRNKKNVKLEKLIESLENEAIKTAMKSNFDFNDLAHKKNVVVTEEILLEKRNRRYLAWNCERLIYSIEGKIEVMRDSLSYFDDIKNSNSNYSLKLNNLYFQILLLVILINQSNK